MTPVSTVSGGTTGTYESYDWSSESYDTNLHLEVSEMPKIAEFDASYDGTGGYRNRCPRDASVCVRANLARRARWPASCGRVGARRRWRVGQ